MGRFPPLKIKSGEIDFTNSTDSDVQEGEHCAGLRSLLFALFTVLTNLTGEALVPHLLVELSVKETPTRGRRVLIERWGRSTFLLR